MRLSLAAASVAISVALLAGCSNSTQSSNLQTIPIAGTSGAYMQLPPAHQQISPEAMPHGKMSRLEVLREMIAGKLPAPFPKAALEKIYEYDVTTHSHPTWSAKRDGSFPTAWVVSTAANAVYALKGNYATKFAIDLYSGKNKLCFSPVTAKESWEKGELYISCEVGSPSSPLVPATIEFDRNTGKELNAYINASIPGCRTSYYYCYTTGYGFDDGISLTNVWVGATQTKVYYCPTSFYSCYTDVGSGFYEWPINKPGNTPTFISMYGQYDNVGNSIYAIGFFDVDQRNNVYFTYQGESGTSPYCFGYGLDEYSSSGTLTSLIPPCGIGLWGGVYVGGNGNLNVIDQSTRINSEYNPLPPLPLPTIYGPTVLFGGNGDPVQGTWNYPKTRFGMGDTFGWIDVITASNTPKRKVNLNCAASGCDGFTYNPTDRL